MELYWFKEGKQEEIVSGLEEKRDSEYLSMNKIPDYEQRDLVPGLDLYHDPQYLTVATTPESHQVTISQSLEQVDLSEWTQNIYQSLND